MSDKKGLSNKQPSNNAKGSDEPWHLIALSTQDKGKVNKILDSEIETSDIDINKSVAIHDFCCALINMISKEKPDWN